MPFTPPKVLRATKIGIMNAQLPYSFSAKVCCGRKEWLVGQLVSFIGSSRSRSRSRVLFDQWPLFKSAHFNLLTTATASEESTSPGDRPEW